MIRLAASMLLVCLILITSSQYTFASNAENLIRVEHFLANVNFSDPKVFYVRNNLDGDVEFQENENASLLVHLSANDEDMDQVKVEYNLLDGGAIVDIQVFLVPETTTNWPLVGGLAGAGLFLAVVIVIVVMVIRKRKKKQQIELAEMRKGLEMRERGQVVTEKTALFEKPDGGEESTLDENVAKRCSRPKQLTPLIEKKMATFERPKKETHNEGEEIGKNEEVNDLNRLKIRVKAASRNPRPQTSKFLSARAAFLVLTLVAVALATSKAPKAKIVINVPAGFVKNGSKIFFNKDFHGRLLLPEALRKQDFEQFAVSQASNKVSTRLDPCSASCKFACDVQTQQCVCHRGYKIEGEICQDVDECTRNKHNCHVQSRCSNTIGGFTCTCNDGYWGDGVTCYVCSIKPCPEGFYQSESCTRTRDRVCTACRPKCDRMTYQAYGCGLTFDRKCIDISKPLTLSKSTNDSDSIDVRTGSKLIVLNPKKNMVLLEDRLRLNSTTTTFLLQSNSPNRTRLNRNSSFYVDVEIEQVNFVPKYIDYDAWNSNENLEFAHVDGFSEIVSKHCRYPAPNHYTIKHHLNQNRQTKVYSATCFELSSGLCPNDVAPGEAYHFRSLNDACETAEDSVICQNPNQTACILQQDPGNLYCTNYTNIVTDIFGIKKSKFVDNPLESFPTVFCSAAYRACRVCRDTCSNCDKSNSRSDTSCSCCYKECLSSCRSYYSEDCTLIPKQCAKGDTSQFTLAMNRPSNLNLQFNCFLKYHFPESLYTLKYRVQDENGQFNSSWISKTLKPPRVDDNPRSKIQKGTYRLDSLEVSHTTNFDISPLLYLRGQRASDKEPYEYNVTSLVDDDATLGKANAAKPIEVQMKTPFSVTIRSWSNGENCQKLSEWSQTLRKPFHDMRPAKVENLGVQSSGQFSYHLQDSHRPPTITVSISEDESIFKYILTNASIRYDDTFRSTLLRESTIWNAKISGVLTSCPGFVTLQVIDEVDDVKVIEQDVVILCPETHFKVDIQVPRKNLQDKERLFSVFLSDAKQKLKLQLAVVDKGSRKRKEPVKKSEDEKPDPWIALMPLFVVTGCVLLCLFALMTYAQITHKPDDDDVKDGPSGWKFVKNKDTNTGKTGSKRKKAQPKDENRLKRRHIILVVFFVIVRVVYSLIFTFSMAFAILTLLHGSNMNIIQEYQEYVQSKIDESNVIALRMDQHREGEVKHVLESSEDVQRSCDFYLGLQLQWLRYNMTCLIQENHLKMFNKLSKKIVKKVTEKVQKLKEDINRRIKAFQMRSKRKLQDTKDRLKNYGKRVYNNGWFALPRGAYKAKKALGRKRRDIATNESYLQIKQFHHESETARKLHWKAPNAFLTRAKRSIADSSFIEFLDFVGAVDQDKLVESENNIKAKLQYAKDGLADFTEVLKTGKSPEHPLSTILMCPLRFMLKSTKEQVKKGIQKIEEGAEWAKSKAACFMGNTSDFLAANDSASDLNVNETDSEFFSEPITYEEVDGVDGIGNISKANKSSLIESARGGSFFNIEKGDIIEEQVDDQKKELLEKEGKYKNVTSVYDADVFIVTKKAVLGVVVVIDILLLIYRGSKTYQIAFRLIQGFEETVRHDEDEFQEKPPAKQRAARLVRRVLDFLAEKFSKFLTFCKTLNMKIMRTNLLPMCIIIAASGAVLYLLIAVVFNVMNVTVIEELGGYDLIATRLDTDYNFTNIAIADQVDFINNNDMRLYKDSVNESLSEYKRMIVDFNKGQRERIEQLNRQLCSLENDTDKCLKEMALSASLLNFDPQYCIIPTLEGTPYEDYDGEAYRQRLKRESKRFVDAIRNIVLETIYFILGVVLSIVIIAVLSYVVFLFLKSRGMVRVKTIHVYKSLPPEILEQFHLKLPKSDDEHDGERNSDKGHDPNKVKVPAIFQSHENINILKREAEA